MHLYFLKEDNIIFFPRFRKVSQKIITHKQKLFGMRNKCIIMGLSGVMSHSGIDRAHQQALRCVSPSPSILHDLASSHQHPFNLLVIFCRRGQSDISNIPSSTSAINHHTPMDSLSLPFQQFSWDRMKWRMVTACYCLVLQLDYDFQVYPQSQTRINNMQQEDHELEQTDSKDQEELLGVSQLGRYLRAVATRISGHWYFSCEICLMEFENHQCGNYANCSHQKNFCTGCLEKYVKFKLLFFEEIHCPKQGCNTPIDITSSFFTSLPESVQRRYRKLRASYEKLHDANFRTCPEESCEGNIVYNGQGFACSLCKNRFCLNCLAREHKGQCYGEELAFFQNILHFRRCPQCKFVIEKSLGCDHITCICKYQFCYKCGDAYSRLHRCKTESSNKNAIKNPPVAQKEEEKLSKNGNNERISKPSLPENIYLGLSLIVVLIPLFIFFTAAFLLWVTAITLKQFTKASLIFVLVVMLGMGPYAFQISKRCGSWRIVALFLIYPLLALMGMRQSFREIFMFMVAPLWRRYKRAVKKCWRTVFVDSMSE